MMRIVSRPWPSSTNRFNTQLFGIMKHIFYSLLILAAVLGFQSCVDDTIGSSLTDTRAAIIEDSSFVITGHSVPNQRIMARTSTQLVGLLKADGYGMLSSEVVTQFIPSTIIDTMGVSADMIDSCRLMLTISPNGFTGDAQPPMRLSVYRLKEQLPTPLYSDFDPTDYYDESGLLGSNSYSPKSTVPVYYETSSGQIEYEAVYVPMPVSLAREIQTEYRQHPETFSSPTAFAKFFPGMYFKNSYGSGRVMNFVRTEFQVFYRKRSTILETDTTTNNTATYMAATPETLQDNIISLDVDASVKQRVADGQAIILAPAGYEVQVRFPIQEIIDKFNTDVGDDLGVINKLELTIPVEDTGTAYDIAPPTNLLMVKTSKKDEFIAGDSLTNNKDSFYATYNSTKRAYVFSGLRAYIMNIIDNQGGAASDDDINLTITPVDVTTYTTQASYYQEARTVVTKIAPMVSAPAITRLRLDKAKVKITYSKQMM